MSDKYYCGECRAIVDPAQHARSINIKPASGHPDAVKVDSDIYAAIQAEQRDKDAKICELIGTRFPPAGWNKAETVVNRCADAIREGNE